MMIQNKKTILRLVTLLVFIVPSICLAQAGKNDTQFWSETWIYAPKFNDKLDMGYTNYTRVGRNVSHITDERQALFVTYTVMPELKFTQHLVFIEQDIPNASKNDAIQYRPMTDASGVFDFTDIRLTYRARVERQFRESLKDRWNFRPRVGFEIPFSVGDYKPYVFSNYEGFYNSDGRLWYRGRLLYGIGCPITPSLSLDLYGAKQMQRDPSQTDFDMFGFILKIKT